MKIVARRTIGIVVLHDSRTIGCDFRNNYWRSEGFSILIEGQLGQNFLRDSIILCGSIAFAPQM
ncbi:hypothetical protein D1223_03760 [Henriciella mobilis]|uniref:Uncharacterized protein n=1 Tax=Henriciella mobilis TaxID=2305467 RepID=A0A399RSY8_9PROT|nr:hypothetical protein D1223_03760 [Henriciella mobilis]